MGIGEALMEALTGGVGAASAGKFQQAIGALPDKAGFSDKPYDQTSYQGDYRPGLYGAPEAAQYQTISEDPRTRDYQMQALSRMQGYADNAANSAESLGRYNAISDANAMAHQREAGIRNQMAMRGQGGSGMDFVMQQMAGQDAANRAQSGGLNAAQQAALQRLNGTQGVMAGASNIRGMDANVAGRNADIINQFNMANTGMRNATNMANTNTQNEAGLRNLNTQQGLMSQNTGIRNQSLDRDDRNKLMNMNSTRQKLGWQSGQNDKTMQQLSTMGQGFGKAADSVMQMGASG